MRQKKAPAGVRVNRHPTATGAITRLAFAKAKAAGVAVEPLLKKARLTHDQIDNPHAPINVRDQITFLNLVATALDDDLLGFHLAQIADLREVGLLYYVLASSKMLIDALQRGVRYTSIVNEGMSQKCIDSKRIGISYHYVGVSRHLDRHQIEFWMTALVRLCRLLTGLRVMPRRVRLIHRREQNPEFAEFFGNDVEFGASVDDITFSNRLRQSPIVSADPYLNNLLVSYAEEALSHRPINRGSLESSVENAIVPLLPHGKARADEIASHLGVSLRTFARRLSMEGLTFSDILENLRFDLADRYLADKDLTISQIAWLLGCLAIARSGRFPMSSSAEPEKRHGRHVLLKSFAPLGKYTGGSCNP